MKKPIVIIGPQGSGKTYLLDKIEQMAMCIRAPYESVNSGLQIGAALINRLKAFEDLKKIATRPKNIDVLMIDDIPDNRTLELLHHIVTGAFIALGIEYVQVIYTTQDNEARYNAGTFDYIFASYHLIPQPQDRN